ncbi:MAG: hypothetical protein K2M54_02895 [Muribaculaceae bacterium]|nr:hypothetical protein [Muribaculaceae bacterium]
MKFFKYSLIAALALSGALCACDDDNDYAPGQPVSGDEVYFPNNQSATIDIPTDATSVSVAVNRLNSDNALTVGVESTVTDSEGADVSSIFSVPSQVAFAAGEATAELTVGVDFSKVVPDEEYSLTLKLTGDNTTPYGASSYTYTLVYAPWTDWQLIPGEEGTYVITQYTSGAYDIPVYFRQSLVNTDRYEYAVCDLYAGGLNYTFSMDMSNTIDVDGVACPLVSMSIFQPGIENGSTGIQFIWTDVRTWLTHFVEVPESDVDAVIAANGWSQSYYNPQTGTFNVFVVLTGNTIAADGSYYGAGYEYLQLPGYKSYELDFNYTGNFVDPVNEVEYAVVSAYKSGDVKSYIYDIFPGKLEGDELDQAIADMKTSDDYDAVSELTTNLTFTLPADGTYTIVGLGTDDANEFVCTEVYSFNYKTVRGSGEADEWTSVGYAEYTDGFVCSLFDVPILTLDVEVQENNDYPGVYRLVDPYKDWCDQLGIDYNAGKHYMIIDASVPDEVILYTSELGFQMNSRYGDMYGSSMAYVLLSQERNPAGYYGTLEDGAITFPTGTLLVAMENYNNGSFYYANTDPDNPTGETDDDPYDPNWGQGTFYLDMSSIASTKSAQAPRATTQHAGEFLLKKSDVFESSFKIAAPKKQMKKSVDTKTLNEYRLVNPKRISL